MFKGKNYSKAAEVLTFTRIGCYTNKDALDKKYRFPHFQQVPHGHEEIMRVLIAKIGLTPSNHLAFSKIPKLESDLVFVCVVFMYRRPHRTDRQIMPHRSTNKFQSPQTVAPPEKKWKCRQQKRLDVEDSFQCLRRLELFPIYSIC
jgi:hypothetical protein